MSAEMLVLFCIVLLLLATYGFVLMILGKVSRLKPNSNESKNQHNNHKDVSPQHKSI